MDIVLFILRILIVVALYAFLGVVLYVLLREQRPGYVLIQIPGGDGGWVEAASVEPVFAR